MEQPRRRSPAPWASLLLGCLLLIAGLGGTRGVAYGQTAGPTPTAPAGEIGNVSLLKQADKAVVQPGQTIVFTLIIVNRGTLPVPRAVLTDDLASFLEIMEVSSTAGTASFSGQSVRVELENIGPGATITVTIIARVRPNTPPQQTVNVALLEIISDPPIPPGSSNPVAIGVDMSPPSSLPGTGAAPSGALSWGLIGAGALLIGAGALLLLRRKRLPLAGSIDYNT